MLVMKRFSLVFVLLLILFSCSDGSKQQFEFGGGTLTMALENEPTTFIARDVLDIYSATVLHQIMEGLVGFDPKTIKIIPRLATEWTKSDDGKIYVFTLNDQVLFHPHAIFKTEKDRRLTTADVMKTFEMCCTLNGDGVAPSSYSMIFQSNVKGADEFLQGKATKISGITVDGNKIKIELLNEDHNFLNKLAHVNLSILSEKIIEQGEVTDVIGTGPFIYSKYTHGATPSLALLKNKDYYKKDNAGNALPYLDSLVFVFQSRKLEQLDMFESGMIDLIIGLPTNRITRMLEGRIEDFNSKPPKLVLANNPLLETHFYYFNMEDERFQNPLVRKAFNYAIDKEVIGREILKNQFYDLGEYGLTPPISLALKGYDFKSLKAAGYSYNPELAKKLLAQGGYPKGEGFGSVELRYNINDIHSAVADEFSKQIFKTLGINVNIDGSTFEQLNEDGANGKGDIFRMGWAADYASPESFLMNFYGNFVPVDSADISPINKARYKNPVFDEFYEQAQNSRKIADQMRLFSIAEVELLKNPPIIPLWYSGNVQITNSYVRNFYFNAIGFFDFREVYLKEWSHEEYKETYNY